MLWLDIQADLKRNNQLLERLTKVAEQLLYSAYGVRLGHVLDEQPNPSAQEKATVTTEERELNNYITPLVRDFEARPDCLGRDG